MYTNAIKEYRCRCIALSMLSVSTSSTTGHRSATASTCNRRKSARGTGRARRSVGLSYDKRGVVAWSDNIPALHCWTSQQWHPTTRSSAVWFLWAIDEKGREIIASRPQFDSTRPAGSFLFLVRQRPRLTVQAHDRDKVVADLW